MRITLPQLNHGHRCTVDMWTDKLPVATDDKGVCMHAQSIDMQLTMYSSASI